MSADDRPIMTASARQIVRALARYERHVRRLAGTWLDMDLYNTVSEEIDDVRAICGLVPQLALASAGLLVSHADLVHALWRSGETGGAGLAPEVAAKLQEHLACIDGVARHALRLSETTAPPAMHD